MIMELLNFYRKFYLHFNRGLKKVAKVGIVLAVLYTVLILFVRVAIKDNVPYRTATANDYERKRVQLYKNIKDPKYQKNAQTKQNLIFYRFASCKLTGELCTTNPDEAYKYQQSSMIYATINLLAMPYYNPPASGIHYVYNGLGQTHLIPKAYAV